MMAFILAWCLRFTVFNSLLLICITLHDVFVGPAPTTFAAFTYLALTFLGQMTFLAFLPCFIIPVILSVVVRKRPIVIGFTALLASAVCIYLLTDTMVFSQYHFHINGLIVSMLLGGNFTEIFNFSTLFWCVVLALTVAIVALEMTAACIIMRQTRKASQKTSKLTALWLILMIVSLGASELMHAWYSATLNLSVIQYSLTAPLYFPMTAQRFLLRHDLIHKKKHTLQFPITHISQLKYPLHPLRSAKQLHPYNILLIVIDTWRFDTFTPKSSPYIYHFSKKATVFERHFSGGDCTQPCIFSLFYSIPGTYWNAALDNKQEPALMTELIKKNYRIKALASAGLNFPRWDATIFHNIQHLQVFTPGGEPWQRDQKITQQMKVFLNQKSNSHRPFFGFLFYDSVHSSSLPPNRVLRFKPSKAINYLTLHNSPVPTTAWNFYRNTVVFDDQQVHQVLKTLNKKHLLKNTIVIITADYGQELNDNGKGYWGHGSNFSPVQTHVPFIIYWPGKKPATVHRLTTHYDVATTLLQDALGVSNPTSDFSIGSNLYQTKKTLSFFPVASYVYAGIVTPQNIMTLYPSGYYRTTNLHLNPVHSAFSPKIRQQALQQMSRYY